MGSRSLKSPALVGGADAMTGEERLGACPLGPERKARVVLAAVLLGFVVAATVIAVKTPAYESADEPSHVRNIKRLSPGTGMG